ncbi:MAG: TonB family protein [Thiotrichaceae bacterium]|nr:TonB family protein [Thiotrichaceae bacterium]
MKSMFISISLERLIVALIIAVSLHYITIEHVGFVVPTGTKPPNTMMKVMLVPKRTTPATTVSKPADALANVTQDGGGDVTEEITPATPVVAPFPDQSAPVIATPPPPQVAVAPEVAEIEVLTTPKVSPRHVPAQQRAVEPETKTDAPEGNALETTEPTPPMPASTLILNARANIASIQAEIDQKFEARSKRPRKKFISASTREYKYASYMEAWRKKVERVGDLNYPSDAIKQKITGRLILDVALNPDGTINQVEISKSSGQKVLDDAALRIVHLAAPYAPFSEEIRKETDILHITRTWIFSNNRLSGR